MAFDERTIVAQSLRDTSRASHHLVISYTLSALRDAVVLRATEEIVLRRHADEAGSER
jgi:hypothetical protein